MKKFFKAIFIAIALILGSGIAFVYVSNCPQKIASQIILRSFNAKAKNIVATEKLTSFYDVEIALPFGVLKAKEVSFNTSALNLMLKKEANKCTLSKGIFTKNDNQNFSHKITDFKIEETNLDISYLNTRTIASIKNLNCTNNELAFEINGKIFKGAKTFSLFAKKLNNILNVKVSENSREVGIASIVFDTKNNARIKTRLLLENCDIANLPLNLKHAKTELFIDANLNLQNKDFSANAIVKSDVLANNNKLTFESEILLARKSNNLVISKLEAYLRTTTSPIASLKCSDNIFLSDNATNLGELSISIPQEILNLKTNDFELSAENISATFDVSATKKFDITLKQKKEINISNLSLKTPENIIFTGVSLFAHLDTTFNIFENINKSKAKIRSAKVNEKFLEVDILSATNKAKTEILLSANGAINALLNSTKIGAEKDTFVQGKANITLSDVIEISLLSAKVFDDKETFLEILAPEKITFNKQKNVFEKRATIKLATDSSLAFDNISAKKIKLDIALECLNSEIFLNGKLDIDDCLYKNVFDNIFVSSTLTSNINLSTKKSLFVFNSVNLSNSASAIFVGSTALTFNSTKLESLQTNANVQIPAILKLNAFKKFDNISKGSGEISLFYAPNKQFLLNTKIINLASKDFENDISVAELNVSKNIQENKTQIKVQTVSERGNSNFAIQSTTANKFNVLAKNFVLEDAIILKSAFTRVEKNNNQPKTCVKLNRCDTQAFWDFQTTYTTDVIAENFLINSITLKNLTTNIEATPNNFSAKKISANFDESKINANINIAFSQQDKQAYSVKNSEVSIENFDVSKTAFGKILDAKISAKIDIFGKASDSLELFRYPLFKARGTAKNGKIKLLEATKNIDNSLLRAQLKSTTISKQKQQLETLLNAFKEIKFSDAKFEIERNAQTFDVIIKNSQFNGDDINLRCSNAKIFFDITSPFSEQKILFPITAKISNRNLASILEVMKSTFAEHGVIEQFHIFGTLEKPKTNLLEVLTEQGNSAINNGIKINLFK